MTGVQTCALPILKKGGEEGGMGEEKWKDGRRGEGGEEIGEKVIKHEGPHDNDWTNRLGI